MPTVKKIVAKMRRQPNGITPQEADRVLGAFGYKAKRQTGSHIHYTNEAGDVITVKHSNPLKRAYVEDILQRIGGDDNEEGR